MQNNSVNLYSKYGQQNIVRPQNTYTSNIPNFCAFNTVTQDIFQPSISREEIIKNKFNALFPDKEINKIYNKINEDFQIETPASLNFVYDEKSQRGGGYTFNKNEIEMNLYDLMASDKKIVGIKDGKKIPLISPAEHLPLFIDEKNANEFVKLHSQNGNLGFDKLVVEEVTPKEQQKFIIQKIAHECVHAKQHEILRQTEGIGDKEIIKAWNHDKSGNLVTRFIKNYKTYKNSPWANGSKPEIKYSKDSQMGKYAYNLLNAIKNYPPVTSSEYKTNALEKEAFDVSYDYVNSMNF